MSLSAKNSAMIEGGTALGSIKAELKNFAVAGRKFEEIEAKAQELIKKAGMSPSFSTVEGYKWATCIMKNEELCHGIPEGKTINPGDLITIDVGLINKGYHLDTTISFGVEPVSAEIEEFLSRGRRLLDKSISVIKPGKTVYDISYQMDHGLRRFGYGAVYQLTGHGIGESLHMLPEVPVVARRSDKRIKLQEGQTLAVEIMYTQGSPTVKEAKDGWTFVTVDGSLSAMFEETVLVTKTDVQVLTKAP